MAYADNATPKKLCLDHECGCMSCYGFPIPKNSRYVLIIHAQNGEGNIWGIVITDDGLAKCN